MTHVMTMWLAGGLWNGFNISPLMVTILQIVVAGLMILGLFSLFFYIFPGLTIIWLAALVYWIVTGFSSSMLFFFIPMTLLMIFGNFVDQLIMGIKARQSGANWRSIVLSTLAALFFSIVFPPFGGIIAALIVLFAFEFFRLRDLRKAGNSTGQMALGCATAILARFLIGIVMLGLWIGWLWQSNSLPF